jgi:hypothetical protein
MHTSSRRSETGLRFESNLQPPSAVFSERSGTVSENPYAVEYTVESNLTDKTLRERLNRAAEYSHEVVAITQNGSSYTLVTRARS